MESVQNLISKVNKEKLFYLYKEISNKIENGTYEKLFKDLNNENKSDNDNDNENKLIIFGTKKRKIIIINYNKNIYLTIIFE